ncbi:hypothetical protein F4819DRAFT_505660 [Hypoxylon fuscum]|nr:hypothetical protein F4819DRAFT_505660 [Hypoxylon fuscum]
MVPTPIPAPPLDIPASKTTVKVSIIDSTGRLGKIPTSLFFEPPIPGYDFWSAPSYCFLIEHGPSGHKLLYDLGLRKDPDNHPPAVKKLVDGWALTADKDVADVLVENGVALVDIKDIFWSHRHFDHNGDPSLFPPTTNLIVGPGFKKMVGEGYPGTEDSIVTSSAWEGRKFIELDFESDKRATQVDRWKAIDWFGDGSFYLLQSPGHTVDHISALARTKLAPQSSMGKDEFIFIGGDVAHHGGELKPNLFSPIPAEIAPDPRLAPYAGGCCPGEYYAQYNRRHEGDARWNGTVFTTANGFLDDPEKAAWSLGVVEEFDAHDNVFVVFAHDDTLLDVVDFYPKDATDWKEKGWKREGYWRFLESIKGSG